MGFLKEITPPGLLPPFLNDEDDDDKSSSPIKQVSRIAKPPTLVTGGPLGSIKKKVDDIAGIG